MKPQQVHGNPRLIGACADRRLTDCCLWGSHQLAHLASVHCKITYNEHFCIKTESQSKGRRSPGLMNHIFFCLACVSLTWKRDCTGVPYRKANWQRKYSIMLGRLLAFIWILLSQVPPTQILLQSKYSTTWRQYYPMAVASARSTLQQWFKNGLRDTTSC